METLLQWRETALRGAPLARSPPPHLQPASRPPPASGPQAPRAAVRSRPPPGDRGGRRARRGRPRPSGRRGSSQQQRQPLTWKVTAEEEEEEDAEEEEGEKVGEETPLVPLFSLPRRPLLAQAERVWWGVSGSISLRTQGGRARREGRDPDRLPRLLFPLFIFLTLYGDGPGQGPRGSGGSREARAAAVRLWEPRRPPPLPVCGRTGLFLAAPPRTEVTRRSARRGRAGGEAEGGREEEGETQPATSSDPPARPREGG